MALKCAILNKIRRRKFVIVEMIKQADENTPKRTCILNLALLYIMISVFGGNTSNLAYSNPMDFKLGSALIDHNANNDLIRFMRISYFGCLVPQEKYSLKFESLLCAL